MKLARGNSIGVGQCYYPKKQHLCKRLSVEEYSIWLWGGYVISVTCEQTKHLHNYNIYIITVVFLIEVGRIVLHNLSFQNPLHQGFSKWSIYSFTQPLPYLQDVTQCQFFKLVSPSPSPTIILILHHWTLTFRLFNVISRTLVGGENLTSLQWCKRCILLPKPIGK